MKINKKLVHKAMIMRRTGYTWKEICQATGLTQHQLTFTFKKHGLMKTGKQYITDPDFLDRIAQLKREGKTQKEISKITGASVPTISQGLKRRGF